MAVILDFKLDQDGLADDRRYGVTSMDPGIIETTYFMWPVRFCVDDRDLLNTPLGAWLPQPVVGLATHLCESLRTLRSERTATCSIAEAGSLYFQRHGERVHMRCSFNAAEAEVALDELDLAIRRFRHRIGETLRTRVPELTTHPSWNRWFPIP